MLVAALRTVGVAETDLRSFRAGELRVPFFLAHGAGARALWERLRRCAPSTGHWPVVLGAVDEVDQVTERSRDIPVASILADAEHAGVDPDEWAERRRIAGRGRFHAMGVHFTCRRSECEQGFLDDPPFSEDEQGPVSIPAGVDPVAHVMIPYASEPDDGGERWTPLAEVVVALVPTPRPWEVAAFLQFGGFNACPFPAEHVAIHRHWGQAFGATLFGMTHDAIELVVDRPPIDREAVLALARRHRSYSEHWDHLDLGHTAAHLAGATVWPCWWD